MIGKIINLLGYELIKKSKLKKNNKNKKKNKSAYSRFRHTSQYKTFRKKIIAEPDCKCWNCETVEELTIHHIIPISEDISKIFDRKNIVVVCKSCHDQFHAEVNRILADIKKVRKAA
jgi:5-methylcytosine-specific restriction endonuclease McrA